MLSTVSRENRKYLKISEDYEGGSSLSEVPHSLQGHGQWLLGYLEKMLTFPLALLLLSLALFYLLYHHAIYPSQVTPMSRTWPWVAHVQPRIQRLLRHTWRAAQPKKRFAR